MRGAIWRHLVNEAKFITTAVTDKQCCHLVNIVLLRDINESMLNGYRFNKCNPNDMG